MAFFFLTFLMLTVSSSLNHTRLQAFVQILASKIEDPSRNIIKKSENEFGKSRNSHFETMKTDDTSLAISYGGAGADAPNSLWDWLVEVDSFREPNSVTSPALAVHHQSADHLSGLLSTGRPAQSAEHFSWTCSNLLDAVESLAAIWSNAGVRAGDAVFTFVENSAEWALFFYTSIRMGTVFVPLEPKTVKRKEELRMMIETLQPAVVLAQDRETALLYEKHIGDGSCEKFKAVCQSNGCPGWQQLSLIERLPDLQSPSVPFTRDPDSTACLIMFTSGTTNAPKGCPVSVTGMAAQISQYHESAGPGTWTPQTRMLINTNNFRPICYLACLSAWKAGGSVVFPSATFSPERSLRILKHGRCTHTWFVPAQLNMISSLHVSEQERPSTLKIVLTSGDVADSALLRKTQTALQPEKIVYHWGMSECAPLMGYRDNESAPRIKDGLVGVGRALSGTYVMVAKSGTHVPAKKSEHGDLHVSSQALIRNYLNGVKAEDFYDDAEGKRWFKTGDVAVMEEDGVIFVVGRTKDVIKCKGFGIVPSIMEHCLDEVFKVEVSLFQR